MRRRLREVLERQADISEQTKDGTHLSTNVAQTMQQMVQMSVVATGAILVADGEFGFGAIIAATILSGKAIAPFAQLSQLLVRLNQIGVSYEALKELMSQPIEHPQSDLSCPTSSGARSSLRTLPSLIRVSRNRSCRMSRSRLSPASGLQSWDT